MNINSAKQILEKCQRQELRDHAFGDCEIFWIDLSPSPGPGEIVRGFAYLSGRDPDEIIVYFPQDDHLEESKRRSSTFTGDDFKKLRSCGHGVIERNDSTGPDTFIQGRVARGLTLDDVREEIFTDALVKRLHP